jgi:hypothetical protein
LLDLFRIGRGAEPLGQGEERLLFFLLRFQALLDLASPKSQKLRI